MSVNKPQLPAEDQVSAAADPAGEAADAAVRTPRRGANHALDLIVRHLLDTDDHVQPAIARIASQAESLARKSLDAVKDGAYNVRDRANNLGDVTVRYVREEPVKAVLIAAATGAALMALLSLVNSARRNNDR